MEKEHETRLVQADLKRVGYFSHNPDAYFAVPDGQRHQNVSAQRTACVNRPGKRSFSSLKTALIFPGSRMKTTKEALVRVYQGSSILSCTTSSGCQIGLLFGTGLPSAAHASLCASETWHLMYFYGN